MTRPEPLTGRLLELVGHLAAGLHTHEIATVMHLSQSTVKTYLAQLCDHLHATNRQHAVALAYQNGDLLVTPLDREEAPDKLLHALAARLGVRIDIRSREVTR